MRYIYIFILLLFASSISAQKKYAAEQYFKKFAYVKSAELYEELYDKGDESQKVLSRLGDAYYFNNNYEEAKKWYQKLFDVIPESDIATEHYYRYVQTLKGLEKYDESNRVLVLSEENGKEINLNIIENISDLNVDDMLFNKVENLSINTSYSEYNNIVINDTLYFSSTRPNGGSKQKIYSWNKQPYYAIYSAKLKNRTNDISSLVDTEMIEGKINGSYHDASPVITKDGKTMYFTRDNSKGKNRIRLDGGKTSNLKLYQAELKKGKWKCVKALPFNNKNYSVGQPSLSKDEKFLYFVSDMPGGYGLTDIYRVAILGDDEFGEPENLGNTINTAGKEMFPYVKENKLYFSSDGHLGFGGLDIFRSRILNNNAYTEPKNLNKPLNSIADDFSFILLNNNGYFSSNRIGGKGDDDIYSFGIEEMGSICEKQIKGVVLKHFKGSVCDALENEKLINAEVKLLDSLNNVISTLTTDKNGTFDFGMIGCDKKYIVQVFKKDYHGEKTSFEISKEEEGIVNLSACLFPIKVKINPIYFDFDESYIREDASLELDKVVKVMKDYPEIELRIESHTDSRGNDLYNEGLSDRRAKSSEEYIINQGVSKERILSAKGFGEYKLLNKCSNDVECTEEEHQLNRRSYFYISNNPHNISVENQVE